MFIKITDGRTIDTELFLTKTKRKLDNLENFTGDLIEVRFFLNEVIGLVKSLTLYIDYISKEIGEKDKTISALIDGNNSLVEKNAFLSEQLWGVDDKTEEYEKKINSLELKNKMLGKAISDSLNKINDVRNELLAYRVAFVFDVNNFGDDIKTESLQDDDCK